MFKTVLLVAALASAARGFPPITDVTDIRNLQIAGPLKGGRVTNEIDEITGEDYLQPDWAAQGFLESEEDDERSERSASSDSDDEFSDCDFDSSEESSEERIPESNVKPEGTAEWTTVDAVPEATTEKPVDIPDIDRRFGVKEVRQKRMAWRVMHSSNEFDDDKPSKVRWMWDDQKPEVPPAAKEVDEPDGFGPRVDEVQVDVRKPCASKFYRRDRHGRCRLTLV